MKILRISITRARASQASPASTVKLVRSHITFPVRTKNVKLQCCGKCVKYIVEFLTHRSSHIILDFSEGNAST